MVVTGIKNWQRTPTPVSCVDTKNMIFKAAEND